MNLGGLNLYEVHTLYHIMHKLAMMSSKCVMALYISYLYDPYIAI